MSALCLSKILDGESDQQDICSDCVETLVEGLACNGITVGHSCHIIPTQLFQWLQCNCAGLWTGNAASIACVVHVLHVSQTGSGKTYIMGTGIDGTMLPEEKGSLSIIRCYQ